MHYRDVLRRIIERAPFPSFFIDVFSHLRHPLMQVAVWRDYWQTRRAARFFASHDFGQGNGKIALIGSVTNWIYQVKIEAMLGLGLRMKGWRVVVLTSRSCPWALRYYRAFGFHELVYWEDIHLDRPLSKQLQRAIDGFLSPHMTFQNVKSWVYEKAWIGPQILSSVSRKIMQGLPDLDNVEVRRLIRRLLPETIATVHRTQKLLKMIKPSLLLVNEANYAMMGALVDTAIAYGVNTIQFTQPYRDDALTFKRLTAENRRIHPGSVAPQSMELFSQLRLWTAEEEKQLWQEFEKRYGGAWFLQRRNQPGVKKKEREEIIQQLQLDQAKKIVIVFSPVLWDANLFFGDDLFEDYGDWFVQTVRAACANPAVNWIIKLHPANLWKRARDRVEGEYSEITLLKKHIGKLPRHVHFLYPDTDISTWSLFQISDYGITVRGTVGMELPCFGVPVFTAGTGRYSGLGFTIDSATKEEYLERLAHIQEYGRLSADHILRAKQHAYIALRLRPWPIKSFKARFNYLQKGKHPLDHNLCIQVRSWEEIAKNGDLEKWAVWAEDTSKIDYLHL